MECRVEYEKVTLNEEKLISDCGNPELGRKGVGKGQHVLGFRD